MGKPEGKEEERRKYLETIMNQNFPQISIIHQTTDLETQRTLIKILPKKQTNPTLDIYLRKAKCKLKILKSQKQKVPV